MAPEYLERIAEAVSLLDGEKNPVNRAENLVHALLTRDLLIVEKPPVLDVDYTGVA